MSLFNSFKSMFKNEVTIIFRNDDVVFKNEKREFSLQPFIIVTDKRIVLAVGEDLVTTGPKKKVEFFTDTSISYKERSEYLQAFIKFGLMKAAGTDKIFIRPVVTMRPLATIATLNPNAEQIFTEAAVAAGARTVNFSE